MYRKMAGAASVVAVSAASLAGAQPAQAATVSVPCSSVALASAMTSAASGDTLSLAAGCVYRQATLPTITASLTIDGNGATLRDGGGIYNRDGQVTASGSQITRNFAGTGGGGIYSAGQDETVTLTTSPVTRNRTDNCEPANTVTGCTG